MEKTLYVGVTNFLSLIVFSQDVCKTDSDCYSGFVVVDVSVGENKFDKRKLSRFHVRRMSNGAIVRNR